MEVTLQSTGSARRWAKNTIQQHVTKSKRGGNTDYSLGNKKSGEGGGMGRNAAGPCSPLHGPGSTITGTLPRRRRRHTTGASTARRDGDNNSSRSGAALGPASSGPAFESDRGGRTARWQAAHTWVTNPVDVPRVIDSFRVWERPQRHTAPKGVPVWQTAVLRTRLLEPNDSLPRHKTRAELLRTLHKKKCIAHHSFDLDGDGVVSITDYKLAKDMDTDGSGHIDGEETRLGRTRLARSFFETKNQVTSRFHRRDWHEMEKSAKELVKKGDFGRHLTQLRQGLWIRQGRSGRRVVDSLSFEGQSQPSARFGAGASQMPRSTSVAGLRTKRRSKFLREAHESCRPDSYFFEPVIRYGRQSLLTDMKRSNHEGLNGDKLREFGASRVRSGAGSTAPKTAAAIAPALVNTAMESSRRHLFGAAQ